MVGRNMAQPLDGGVKRGVLLGEADAQLRGGRGEEGRHRNGGHAMGAGPLPGPMAVVSLNQVAGIQHLEEATGRRGPFPGG